jgi:hypothetical protein
MNNNTTPPDIIDTLLNGIHKVEAPAFLLTRIQVQTEYLKESIIPLYRAYSAIFAFALLFFVNAWAIQQNSISNNDVSVVIEEMNILSNENLYGD